MRRVTAFYLRQHNPGDWTPASVTAVVVGVLALSAFFVWRLWRLYLSMERAERDARYRRRVLMRLPILYGASAVFGIVLVASGREPIQTLLGLPVVALLIWLYLKAALAEKVSPKPNNN